MLLTQTESVIRLRLPLGSSFTATTNGLKLTADAISAGFELTEFARKFPVTNNIAGPLGIAFPSSGGVLVSDYGGNVRRFPSHADGQDASLFAPSQNYGFNGANDIARVGRNLYMTQYAASAVAQINDDGTFNQTIVTGLKEPTGIVVNCQNERSQHKNRASAMTVLLARVAAVQNLENEAKMNLLKGDQGPAGWGRQIRSYVFQPYTMVKDHRTAHETGNVTGVMDGDIDGFIEAFLRKAPAESDYVE